MPEAYGDDSGNFQYSGLFAEVYDLLISNETIGDADFFRAVIRDRGEPALEIGCGTGRLLLDYVAEGLDVEGVDLSEDMLRICRRKAEARGLSLAVHAQAMQALDLPRRFKTVFVPASSFMLLTERREAELALQRFYAHLTPGGQVLIPLHLPHKTDIGVDPAPEGVWRLRRQGSRPDDGTMVECWEKVSYDLEARLRVAELRYEVKRDGRTIERQEGKPAIRWYTQDEFCAMLERAGFTRIEVFRGHTFTAAGPDDTAFTCLGRR